MKKYTVHYNFYATVDVEVLAESEEDAKSKARNVDIELEDYELSLNEESIVSEEPAEDLEKLLERAYKKLVDNCYCMDIDDDIRVTYNILGEYLFEKAHSYVACVFISDEYDEICIETDRGGEICISELPEIEQYYIAQSILKE